jgi:metallo-beta-lactamase family protein
MKISFLGAVGTVTGSKFLVESGKTRVLVDCGLFQGLKQLRLRNWKSLPFAPGELDAVLLTHAHIDHSGYLPVVVREGLSGPIFCTPPTGALCRLLLPDSGSIQEEDARYADRKKTASHRPALPLYTEEDARRTLPRLETRGFDETLRIGDLSARFVPAGHILGAASIELRDARGAVLFSGDLGRADDLLMPPPRPPGEVDWIVMESTYGNRSHGERDPVAAIADVVRRTTDGGGAVLMPSFAVGRAQTLLYCLHTAFEKGLCPRVPVYLNSPMATDVTDLYERFHDYHRLPPEECAQVCDVAEFVRSVEESKRLAERKGPLVIISASGMATGGRVLHHLRALAPHPENTIVLPGFQAAGTRGADIAAGAESVKIHGQWVPLRAQVVQLDLLSAHGDREDLVAWLGSAARTPREVFLVHGEPPATDTLRLAIKNRLGYEPRVPEHLESVELN